MKVKLPDVEQGKYQERDARIRQARWKELHVQRPRGKKAHSITYGLLQKQTAEICGGKREWRPGQFMKG